MDAILRAIIPLPALPLLALDLLLPRLDTLPAILQLLIIPL